MAYHYTVRWTPAPGRTPIYPWGDALAGTPGARYGWAGVELFFVVSGLVILMTLERSRGPLDFARRRFARLWPALAVCAGLTLSLQALGPPEWRVGPASALLSLTLLDPALVGGLLGWRGLGWVDGVYWTLFIEARFYLLAALLYFLAPRRFLETLTALALVSFAAGVRALQYPGRELLWTLLLPSFLPYFLFGCALHRLRAGEAPRGAAACFALAAAMVLAGGFTSFDLPDGRPLPFLGINLAILALAALAALAPRRAALLGARPLARLGEASYSLYLIHSNVGLILIAVASRAAPWPVALAAVCAGLVAAAFGLRRFVEEPGKALILRWTAPRTASPAGPLRPARSAY